MSIVSVKVLRSFSFPFGCNAYPELTSPGSEAGRDGLVIKPYMSFVIRSSFSSSGSLFRVCLDSRQWKNDNEKVEKKGGER